MEPVSDNSNIINSILRITFAILFLVLIAELTYFFYIVPNKKVATTIAPTKASNSLKITLPNKEVIFSEDLDISKILDTKELQRFDYFFEKKVADEFYMAMYLHGKIIGFEMDKNIKYMNFQPEFYLNLQNEALGSKEVFTLAFSKEELKQTRVMDSKGKNITYKDIKIGQNVKIIEIYNLTKKLNSSFEINVLD